MLREGLDLPEVSLIVVLDADKEGFLRSKTSLLQVAGRAARNINGKVILYADKITKSMQYLIEETDRRRKLQNNFNKKHKITPMTIKKESGNILTSMILDSDKQNANLLSRLKNIDKKIESFDEVEVLDLIEKLKRKMKKCAQNFQFEEAALLRDQMIKLNEEIKK